MVDSGLLYFIGAIIFSAAMILIGVGGIRTKSVYVSHPFPIFRINKYTGKQSVGPSIVFIVIGLIFPLLLLSVLTDKIFDIDYSMPIILGISGVVAVFSIFHYTYRKS